MVLHAEEGFLRQDRETFAFSSYGIKALTQPEAQEPEHTVPEPPKEPRLSEHRCIDGSVSPITTMPNTCVSTVNALYAPTTDGSPPQKRVPGGYSLCCEAASVSDHATQV